MERHTLKKRWPTGRAIRFETTPQGCFIPTSHKLNQDGYFRKYWDTEEGGVKEFFHRFIYRAHYGEIPEGYEVDHKCRTRACSNPDHLQILTRSAHKAKTNVERSAARIARAKAYWLEHTCVGRVLAEKYGVSESQGCKWITRFKEETH